jgi:hypothetical protein
LDVLGGTLQEKGELQNDTPYLEYRGSMATYFLAPALVQFRDEINTHFPDRDKSSDGWIGDPSHAARTSDHNPCWSCGGRLNGVVRAIDIDIDDREPARNLREEILSAAVGDHRVWYVISNGIIYSRSYNWAARRYTGSNGHFKHVHVSLRHNAGEFDTSSWFKPMAPPKPVEPGRVHLERVREQFLNAIEGRDVISLPGVRRVQDALNLKYGSGLTTDGYVGPRTLNQYGEHERKIGVEGRPRLPDAVTLRRLLAGTPHTMIEPKPVEKPTPAPPAPAPRPVQRPAVRTNLDIVTANIWRENPEPNSDIALLASTEAHIIGLNEARKFVPRLQKMPGYQCFAVGEGHLLNNPILVREDIKVTEAHSHVMCYAVGQSPARSATIVKFEHGGRRAHICTHLNAHIQKGQVPQDLPRVNEAIRHVVKLERWIRDLRRDGCLVTVSGDFNWSWDAEDKNDWTYSPEAMFARLGMTTSFDLPSNPPGGTLGSRDIDYVAFYPTDLVVTSQSHIPGEHSDHRWLLVNTHTR